MWGLALVAVALGLSNFAAAIGLGVAGVSKVLRRRLALAFGVFEAVMPLVGLLLGHRVARDLGTHAPAVGGGLLVATGLYQLFQSRHTPPHLVNGGWSRLIWLGAVLSLDNLVVGFALGARHVNLAIAMFVITAVSLSLTLIGLEIGHCARARAERWSEQIGGLVLVAVGVATATQLL